MTLDVTKMEALLKEFAEMNPMGGNNECDTYCLLCYADFDYAHEESCAWRQTRELFGLPLPQKPEPTEIKPSNYGMTIAKIWEPALERYLTLKTYFVKGENDA